VRPGCKDGFKTEARGLFSRCLSIIHPKIRPEVERVHGDSLGGEHDPESVLSFTLKLSLRRSAVWIDGIQQVLEKEGGTKEHEKCVKRGITAARGKSQQLKERPLEKPVL